MEQHNKIGLDCLSAEAIRNMFPIGTRVVVWVGVWLDKYQVRGTITGYNFRSSPISNLVHVRLEDNSNDSVYADSLEHDRSL